MTPNRLDTEQNLNYRDDAIDTETDADSVRRRLQRRSARIERREVEEAISKLEAHGDLTDEQRRTVRMLGSDLTRETNGGPRIETGAEFSGQTEVGPRRSTTV